MMRHLPRRLEALPPHLFAICDHCSRPQPVWTDTWLCERCTVIRRDLLRDEPRRAA